LKAHSYGGPETMRLDDLSAGTSMVTESLVGFFVLAARVCGSALPLNREWAASAESMDGTQLLNVNLRVCSYE